ncbi:MAG TPA: DUF1501 domain-containing protein [Urbifossiella sp.]|jgi:uncharacterized protein (DUF1501 family)|nr:DUF1501 domain-containing protein [Urbifossiella sp.]
MLTLLSRHPRRLGDGLPRRAFLTAGGLCVGGLTFADVLRARAAAGGAAARGKSVIMVYLNGGPSHLDMYDLKPDAPVECRGEFRPVRTNVPGLDVCEHLPLHAAIADKFAVIRNMRFQQEGHTGPELYTGFLRGHHPSIGSVVSRVRADAGVRAPLPPYVYLGDANHVGQPGFLGKAHEAYIPGEKAANLGRSRAVTLDQLGDRRALLATFDQTRRDLDDPRGGRAGMAAFAAQALDMMTTNAARDAFDLSKEPVAVREKYGTGTEFLLARRLVEAGVPVVSITPQNHGVPSKCNGQWDHHDHVFECLRAVLPQYDRSVHALLTDLHDRGLAADVAVVIWGEMGRTPRVGTQRGTVGGRDHWPQAGFAVAAGGGFATGQVIGATTARGERPEGRSYTPQNVLATLYRHLGIDPATTTLPDHTGRPVHLLDDPRPVAELL